MQNAKTPPCRSTRAASATVPAGRANVVAPWSQNTMSNAPLSNGKCSASPRTSAGRAPQRSASSRACASCRKIDSHRAGANCGQRNRPLRRTAAEFEHVALLYLSQYSKFGFRNAPNAPGQCRLRQSFAVQSLIAGAGAVPVREVFQYRVWVRHCCDTPLCYRYRVSKYDPVTR